MKIQRTSYVDGKLNLEFMFEQAKKTLKTGKRFNFSNWVADKMKEELKEDNANTR